jgi:hypothetical protein
MRGGRTARVTVLIAVVLGAAILPATAALAKGDMQPASGALSIVGPGLSKPIDRGWKGSCFAFAQSACSSKPGFHSEMAGFPRDIGQVKGAFWKLGVDSSFLVQVGGRSMVTFPPKGQPLGPKYEMTWVLTLGSQTATIHQNLYPYGPPLIKGLPSVPWIYTPDHQTVFGNMVLQGWMPTLPNFFQDLVDEGIPATAPPAPAPPAPPAAAPPAPAAPVASTPSFPVWPVVLGIALLAGLVALGAVAGRPRRRMQPAA